MAERSAVNRNVEGSSPSAGARSGGAMPSPNPGYSITVRVQAPAASGMIGDLTTAIGNAGGVVTALDVVESHSDRIVVDVTSNAADAEHVDVITETIGELDGFVVRKVSDRPFLMHLGAHPRPAGPSPRAPARPPAPPPPPPPPRPPPAPPGRPETPRRPPAGSP